MTPANRDATDTTAKSTVVLGGGCFWCLEAAFQLVRGVTQVTPGYAGGRAEDATYYRVASKKTGHAEVVQVTYDPQQVPLAVLLAMFFTIHDPTTPDRQGYDEGPEYRSAIFYVDQDQFEQAEASIAEAQKHWDKPIVKKIEKLDAFYVAENEHHNFYKNNPEVGYCQVIINPKLAKLREIFTPYLQ